MHGDGRPGDGAVAGDFQVLARGKRPAFHVGEKFLLHAVVILLPAMVGEGSQIVKDQTAVFGIKLCGSVGVSCAPSRAIRVNKLAESGIVRSTLLSTCAHEGE